MGCRNSKAAVVTDGEKVEPKSKKKSKKKKDGDVEPQGVESKQNGAEAAATPEARPEIDASTLPDQLKAQVNAQATGNANRLGDGKLTPLISAAPSVTTSFNQDPSAVPEAASSVLDGGQDVRQNGEGDEQVKGDVVQVEVKPDDVEVSIEHVASDQPPASPSKGSPSSPPSAPDVDVVVTTVTTSPTAAATATAAVASPPAPSVSPASPPTARISPGLPPGASSLRSPTPPGSRTPSSAGMAKVAALNRSRGSGGIPAPPGATPHPPKQRSFRSVNVVEVKDHDAGGAPEPHPPPNGSLSPPGAHHHSHGQYGSQNPLGHDDDANLQSVRSEASESEWTMSYRSTEHYRLQQEKLRQPGAPPPIPANEKKAALAALRQSFASASSRHNTPPPPTPAAPPQPPAPVPAPALLPPTKPSHLAAMTPEPSPPASPRYNSLISDESLRQPGAPPPLSMEEKKAALAALKHSYKSGDSTTFTAPPKTPTAGTPASLSTANSFANTTTTTAPPTKVLPSQFIQLQQQPVAQPKPTTTTTTTTPAKKPITTSTTAAATAAIASRSIQDSRTFASRGASTTNSAAPSRQGSSISPAPQQVSAEILSLYSPRKARPGLPPPALSPTETQASLDMLKKSFNDMKSTKEQWAPPTPSVRSSYNSKTPRPLQPTQQEAVKQKLNQLLETNKSFKPGAPMDGIVSPKPQSPGASVQVKAGAQTAGLAVSVGPSGGKTTPAVSSSNAGGGAASSVRSPKAAAGAAGAVVSSAGVRKSAEKTGGGGTMGSATQQQVATVAQQGKLIKENTAVLTAFQTYVKKGQEHLHRITQNLGASFKGLHPSSLEVVEVSGEYYDSSYKSGSVGSGKSGGAMKTVYLVCGVEDASVSDTISRLHVTPLGQDVSLGTWEWAARAMRPRKGHTAVTVESKLFLIGGCFVNDARDDVPMASVDECAVGEWKFVEGKPLSSPRAYHVAATVASRIIVTGGIDSEGGAPLATTCCYDPLIRTWSNLEPLKFGRQHASCGVANNVVYVVGGDTAAVSAWDVEYLDLGSGHWAQGPDMRAWRTSASAAVWDSCIYLAGGKGREGTTSDSLQMLDPRSGWQSRAPMLEACIGASAVAAHDRMLVIGGFNAHAKRMKRLQIYDVRMDSWTAGPDLMSKRSYAAAVTF